MKNRGTLPNDSFPGPSNRKSPKSIATSSDVDGAAGRTCVNCADKNSSLEQLRADFEVERENNRIERAKLCAIVRRLCDRLNVELPPCDQQFLDAHTIQASGADHSEADALPVETESGSRDFQHNHADVPVAVEDDILAFVKENPQDEDDDDVEILELVQRSEPLASEAPQDAAASAQPTARRMAHVRRLTRSASPLPTSASKKKRPAAQRVKAAKKRRRTITLNSNVHETAAQVDSSGDESSAAALKAKRRPLAFPPGFFTSTLPPVNNGYINQRLKRGPVEFPGFGSPNQSSESKTISPSTSTRIRSSQSAADLASQASGSSNASMLAAVKRGLGRGRPGRKSKESDLRLAEANADRCLPAIEMIVEDTKDVSPIVATVSKPKTRGRPKKKPVAAAVVKTEPQDLAIADVPSYSGASEQQRKSYARRSARLSNASTSSQAALFQVAAHVQPSASARTPKPEPFRSASVVSGSSEMDSSSNHALRFSSPLPRFDSPFSGGGHSELPQRGANALELLLTAACSSRSTLSLKALQAAAAGYASNDDRQ